MSAGNKKAFTLVELLVVIAIIAVLIGILMPTLVAVRSQARSAVCKLNLRQLLVANIGYATENNGFYVAAASDMWAGPGHHRWHGVRDSLDEPFDPLRSPLAGYLADGKVKECPEKVNFVKGQGWGENFEQGCGGYGYNMMYLGSRLWQSGITTMSAYKAAYAKTTQMTQVGKPSKTLMFSDCALSKKGRYYIEYSFAEPAFTVFGGKLVTSFYLSPSIHFRHRDWANIGWSDGHVDCRMMASFERKNAYGVYSAGMKLGWFEPIDNSLFDLK